MAAKGVHARRRRTIVESRTMAQLTGGETFRRVGNALGRSSMLGRGVPPGGMTFRTVTKGVIETA